jgi:hypothetical protein
MLVAALPAMAAAADVTISNIYVGGQSGEYGTMSIDLTTGVTTFSSVGTTTQILAGIGFGSDGKLYGLGFPGGHLIQFTSFTNSAATTDLGATGFTAAAGAANSSGVMFGLDSSSPSNLFKVTPPSPSGSLVGNTGLAGPSGMAAFAPNNSALYASNTETSGTNNLYTVNTSTGASTLVGTMFTNGAALTAGTFATASDGTLHLIGFESNGGNNVYDVNFSTGAVTLIGSYSFGIGNADEVFAATFLTAPTVPEPATLILLGSMGVMGLGFRAWKKRTAVA